MSRACSRRPALSWPRRRAASVAVLAAVAVLTGGLDVARAPQAAPALAATPAAASGPALLARPDLPSAQSAARIEGARVLIESETTESSKTYAEPNGTLTTESNPVPVRVRQGDGWADIDPTDARRAGRQGPAPRREGAPGAVRGRRRPDDGRAAGDVRRREGPEPDVALARRAADAGPGRGRSRRTRTPRLAST